MLCAQTVHALRRLISEFPLSPLPSGPAQPHRRPLWALPFAILLALMALLGPQLAHAEDEAACQTPRAAIQQFLDYLQPDLFDPHQAVRCFERPSTMSPEVLMQRARELKAVLDHKGLRVHPRDIPDEPDYTDALGRALYEPFPRVDTFRLRRQGEEWRIPATAIGQISDLYRRTFSSTIETLLTHLPTSLRYSVFDLELWQLLALLLMLSSAWLLSTLTMLAVRNRLGALFRRWQVETDLRGLTTISRPLGLFAAAAFVVWVLPELRLPVGLSRALLVLARLGFSIASVMVVYRLVDVLIARFASKAAQTDTKMDDQLVMLVGKTARALVIIAGVLAVLQNLDVNVSGLLAGLGIGGLALALAAKDTAANLLASVTIFLDKPFQVGDWIMVANIEGAVLEVGLRSTRIRTAYDSVISVPNSKLADNMIDNYSLRTARRFRERFRLSYETTGPQVEAFVEGVRAILTAHPIARKDNYTVAFVNFGESGLEVLVNAFFTTPSWVEEQQARHQFLLAVRHLADDLGVQLALPTRTLHIRSQATPEPREPQRIPATPQLIEHVEAHGPDGAQVHHVGQVALTEHGFFSTTPLPNLTPRRSAQERAAENPEKSAP